MTHASPSTGALLTLTNLGARCSVLSGEQAPFGAVLWLAVEPTAPILSAATTREVCFEETGVVARLRARNRGPRPLLVPGDLVVDGGRQARVVESSIVLPPEVDVDVPVRCVEQGRWHPKPGAERSSELEIRGAVSSRTRASFAKDKTERLVATGRYELYQRAVWCHVGEELSRTNVRSSTQSYAAILDDGHAKAALAARELARRAPAKANGLVLAHASGSIWIEVLPTREDLRAAAESLLADLFDPARLRHAAGRVDAPHAVLERAWNEPLAPLGVPPRTLGKAFALRTADACGSALLYEGRLAHLGVGNAAAPAGVGP